MQPETFIHPTAIVDEGAVLEAGVSVWHFCHLMPQCHIGAGSSLGQNVFVGKGVVLGKGVRVQNNVSLYEGVQCEDEVFIGPSAVFTNVINPRSAVPRKSEFKPTVLRRGCTIGANATIICGNEIGSYAFVGAGSVVAHPVKAYALVVGCPAQQVGWMSAFGHRLHFNEAGRATCPESGETYALESEQVRPVPATGLQATV